RGGERRDRSPMPKVAGTASATDRHVTPLRGLKRGCPFATVVASCPRFYSSVAPRRGIALVENLLAERHLPSGSLPSPHTGSPRRFTPSSSPRRCRGRVPNEWAARCISARPAATACQHTPHVMCSPLSH